MGIAEDLGEIRMIELLKARYFRLMDNKDWAEYRNLFTDDMVFWHDGASESDSASDPVATSGDAFVSYVSAALETAITVHHGHMPEIELTAPGEAVGTWAMYDWVNDPQHDRAFIGFGHYHETYRKTAAGNWQISSIRLTRLRIDSTEPTPLSQITRATRRHV